MNTLRYEVNEVLSEPRLVEDDEYSWWEVKVNYHTQRGLKETTLVVSNKKIADSVEKGFELWR